MLILVSDQLTTPSCSNFNPLKYVVQFKCCKKNHNALNFFTKKKFTIERRKTVKVLETIITLFRKNF